MAKKTSHTEAYREAGGRESAVELRLQPYDRRRLVAALESYLRACYIVQTAARVSEFAQHLGLSRPYVSRLYRRVVGQPVSDLMRELQVQRAEQLLRSTDSPLSEVATLAGFGTEMTLHRVFAARRGTTPGKYRQQVTK